MRFPSWLVYILHVWAGLNSQIRNVQGECQSGPIFSYIIIEIKRHVGAVWCIRHELARTLVVLAKNQCFPVPCIFSCEYYMMFKSHLVVERFLWGLSWFCHILRFSSWPGIQTAQHGCHPPSELNPWWCEPFENVRNPGLDGAFIISMPGADFFVISHRCKWASFPFIVTGAGCDDFLGGHSDHAIVSFSSHHA